MFAVVTKNDYFSQKRRYQTEVLGSVVHFSVGQRVSRRVLKRILKPFGGRFLATPDINLHGFKPYDTTALSERLLFRQFCRYVLSLPSVALSVGVVDPAGKYLAFECLTDVIAHAASTTVFTFKNSEQYCQNWLSATGTCPEVVERKGWLFGCDCVFAPQGLSGFDGLLFGKGGRGINTDALEFSTQHRALLKFGVDPADLYCMLDEESQLCDCEFQTEMI